ncbi:MAG: hypothetical protein QOE35_292 [Actinomycetota bacterium]
MRKALLALLGAGMLLTVGVGTAFADVAGTSEPREPVPGSTTNPPETRGSNDVNCGGPDNNLVPGAPVTIAGEQTGTGGALVVCQDSADLPIQGRVILAGSAEQGGGYIAADGDKDNAQYNDKAAGFARVDISGSGVTVTCGNPAGDLNAETPGPGDGQDQCG